MIKLIKTANGNFYTANGYSLVNPNIEEEKDYYSKKGEYLKKHLDSKSTNVEFYEIKPEDIEEQIANLSQLTFEVTDDCNLNCTYCAYGELYGGYDKRETKQLDLNKAKLLIDYLVGFWNSNKNTSASKNVYIGFYGGEPLLNMKFIKTIVSYIKSTDCLRFFTFALTTNALLLHHHIDYFAENKFNLLISLDGNEKNNGYRLDKSGNTIFNRITKNMDLIKDKYPEYFEKHVNFHSVLHNKNSVEEILRYTKDNYNKIPSIGEITSAGIKPEMRTKFLEMFKNSSESLIQAENYNEIEKELFIKSPTYQSVTTFLHRYSGFVFKDYNDLLRNSGNRKIVPTGTCIPFSKKMFVTVNGKILPCERISHQYTLGCIDENEVKLDFAEIANIFNNYLKKVIKQCDLCYNKESCIQCIFHLDKLEKNPKCNGFMNEKDFNGYAVTQIEFLENKPQAYSKIMEKVIIK